MLWHNNTTWDENLIEKTMVVGGEEVIDTVAIEAVARFKEWISDVPQLKELRFKRYEPGHIERVAIFRDASQAGIGMIAYLIKNDNGVRRSHIFYSKRTLMPKNLHSKAAVKDVLPISRAELIALEICINMLSLIHI